MIARAPLVDAVYSSSRLNIESILIGANGLTGADPVTWVASLKSYCQARQTVGWKVVLLTVLPQIAPGFNAHRNTANALIRADNSFYDALADIASDPTIGPDAAASDTTYYYDGEHLTALGDSIVAPYVTAAIQTLLL